MRKDVLKWEMIGAVLIILCGAFLHFVFGWTHSELWMAPFVPVNESVWEHLKLAYWPSLVFAVAGYFRWRPGLSGYILAKSAGLLLMPVVILIGYSFYRSLVGYPVIAVDVSLFCIAVVLGQYLSARLFYKESAHPRAFIYFGIIVLLLGINLVYYTFNPPAYPLFMDGNSGGYGIPGR